MVTGHFIPLARADEQREISVCRHGVVHLNWWNMTLRFIERLASVLQDGKTMVVSLGPHCDGDICLSSRDGRGYILTIGPVSLTLNAAEFPVRHGPAGPAASGDCSHFQGVDGARSGVTVGQPLARAEKSQLLSQLSEGARFRDEILHCSRRGDWAKSGNGNNLG